MGRKRGRVAPHKCECSEPGWCERHQVTKSANLFRLCQTDIRYWRAWERGTGPGQGIAEHSASLVIWDCPLCETRHGVDPKRELVCICGTRRLVDGTVIEAVSIEDAHAGSVKQYNTSTTGKVLRWGRAIARWFKGGRPVRTPEQVAEVWAICEPCQYINPAKDACTVCGCRVSLTGAPLFNKLAMATEACPKDKWAALVEVQTVDKKCGGCGGEKGTSARPVAEARTEKRGRRAR